MNVGSRTLVGLALGMSFWAVGSPAAGQSESIAIVESKIESIGLFKNGLAVVRRRVVLPGAGTYDVLDLPEPVHGTFRIECTAQVAVRMTEAQVSVDAPVDSIGLDPASLAGSTVTVHFKQPHLPTLTGLVKPPSSMTMTNARSHHELWNAPRNPWAWSGSWAATTGASIAPARGSLVLETDQGEAVIDPSMVAFVLVERRAEIESTVRRPVMRLTVDDARRDGPIEIGILYLTKGISWAPSYIIDIGHPSLLSLLQKAVIKNELEDFEDAELLLISGYPGIQFGHVLSPLSPATSLSSFFEALGREDRISYSSRANVMAQSVMSNYYMPQMSSGVVDMPHEKGIDLKYESIGRHSMMRGDALLLNTARSEAAHDRIVQWVVPEERDQHGRRIESSGDGDDANSAWDAIRFSNPLKRSLTTGPALVVKGDFALGQQTLYWTSPGEEVVLPVNRSLSVRTRAFELEEQNAREAIELAGSRYYRTRIKGTLIVDNHRDETVEMVIRRGFRGELLSAAGDPTSVLPASGSWNINPRHELNWTIRMEPGDRSVLTYTYQVLVKR